jgi:hypothetical protein
MKQRYLFFFYLFVLGSFNASGQQWGLGFRLGDPSGLTLKKYSPGKAWELSIGRTGVYRKYKASWYSERFYKWYERKGYRYDDFDYTGYRAAAPLAIQLHYLWQKPLERTAGAGRGLYWYYGLGGQARIGRYFYDYRYRIQGSDWIYVTREPVVDIDFGVDGVLGLEYTFRSAPISLFVDGTLFMEVVDDPFLFYTQGGIGGRFRF